MKVVEFFFTHSGINWWKTPPESLDLNPIENLWHELKEYIRCEVKQCNKSELESGIIRFWRTVKCPKMLQIHLFNHLRKVIPRVIDLKGAATGY